MRVEAEKNELVLKNEAGDFAIIPARDREYIQSLISKERYSEIDTYINKLPAPTDYAEDGMIKPGPDRAIINYGDGTQKILTTDTPEYKQLYEQKRIATYDAKTDSYVAPPIGEVEIKAQKIRDYSGCVEGVCRDYAEANALNYDDFRKLNNMFGDAWEIGKNSFGNVVYDASKDKKLDYSQLQVNDMIHMSRSSFRSDQARGIPSSKQHVGRISKIVDGVPYVKHYINKNIGYLEEPINDIKQFTRYTPVEIKRLREFYPIEPTKNKLEFDL